MQEKLQDNLDEVLNQLNETPQNENARISQRKEYEELYCEGQGAKPLSSNFTIPLIVGNTEGPDYRLSLSIVTDILERYELLAAEHNDVTIISPFGDLRTLVLAQHLLKLQQIVGHNFFAYTCNIKFNSDMPIQVQFSKNNEVFAEHVIAYNYRCQTQFDRVAAGFEALPLLLTIARPREGCERRLLKLCIKDMRLSLYKERVEWRNKLQFYDFKLGKEPGPTWDEIYESILRADCKQVALDCLQVISLPKLVKIFLYINDEGNMYSSKFDPVAKTVARIFLEAAKHERMGAVLLVHELAKLVLSGVVPVRPVEHDAVKYIEAWDIIMDRHVEEWWPYVYFIDYKAYEALSLMKESVIFLLYLLYAFFENRNIKLGKVHKSMKFSRWYRMPADVVKEIDQIVVTPQISEFLQETTERVFNFGIDTQSVCSAIYGHITKIFD